MAQAVGSVRAEMEAGHARFGRDMGKATAHAKKFGKGSTAAFKRTNRASAAMTASIQRSIGALILIAGPAALGLFVKNSIKAAGDSAEAWSKFDAVFKDQAESTKQWAFEFGESVGRATTEVAGWLSTLQDTFVPMGLARDKAAELSRGLVALAVDLGSFNDIADQQVIEDFQSALVGNTETVRKYGIVINQTNTKQEIYASGIKKAGEAITEQDKILARYNLILAGTTDAQGDAVKTSDSLNNRIKAMDSSFVALSEAVGKRFAPAASEGVRWIKELTDSTTDFINQTEANRRILATYKKNIEAAPDDRWVDEWIIKVVELQSVLGIGSEKSEKTVETLGSMGKKLEAAQRELDLMTLSGRASGQEMKNQEGSIKDLRVQYAALLDEEEKITKEQNENLIPSYERVNEKMKETALVTLPSIDDAMDKTGRSISALRDKFNLMETTMISAGVVAKQASAFIDLAFTPPREKGDKFKNFIIGYLDLLQGLILASKAANTAVNSIFIPGPGAFAKIVGALILLNAAKAGVQKSRFGTGGSFVVGGDGGTDTTPVSFLATRGERVTVQTPGQQANGGMPGGGGQINLQYNQSNHFEGITPQAYLEETVLPGIEAKARANMTDLVSLKNIAEGSNLGGGLLRTGKG